MKRKSTLDPKQMAISLGEEYQKRKMNGEIYYKYIPNQKSYSTNQKKLREGSRTEFSDLVENVSMTHHVQ